MWRLTFNIIMFIQKIVLLPQRPIWNQNVYSKKHFGAVFQFESSVKSKLSWRWVFTCIAKGGSSHVLLMVGIHFHCWGWVFTFITEGGFHMDCWSGSSHTSLKVGLHVHMWGRVFTCIPPEGGFSHVFLNVGLYMKCGLGAYGPPACRPYIYIYERYYF